MITTTLNAIRDYNPCADGWKKLLKTLGKTQADAEPISLVAILESNGLDDAIWCLRAIDGHDKEIRHFAIECARDVQYLMQDARSLHALDVAERYINGYATQSELGDAVAAAADAAAAVAAATVATAYAATYAARSAAAAVAAAAVGAAIYAATTARSARSAADAATYASDAATYAADVNIREKQRIRFIEMFG